MAMFVNYQLEFDPTPGGSGRQEGLSSTCDPWNHKESDTTKWLNNNKMFVKGVCVWERESQHEHVFIHFETIRGGMQATVQMPNWWQKESCKMVLQLAAGFS